MKIAISAIVIKAKRLVVLVVGLCGMAHLHAQGTAITYQGRLADQGNAANGRYEMEFGLWDALGGGARVAGPLTNSAVNVSNGIFTVTIDFGSSAFNGSTRWLQIGVRTNGSVAAFGILSPRQQVTPAPYAIMARGLNGVLPDSQLSANIARLDISQSMNGDLTIANPYDLNFGNSTRQMINLWRTNYGIGVQNSTLYMRSDEGFAWFRDGVHDNTANSAGAGGATLMVLTSGGALGLGTNTPAHRLDVNGNAAFRGSILVNHDSTQDGSYPELPGLMFGDYNTGELISSQRGTNGANRYGIDFYTAYAKRLSILNNGRVGIGTTNPASLLDVNGGVSINGNVGIGTTTPGSKLDINTGAGTVQFRNEGGLTPGLNISGGYLGTMRFRNALEIWPDDTGARAGYLDVRDTNGANNIILRGNGTATVKVLEVTGGADIAEPFQMSSGGIPKGAVVIIDDQNPGQLKLSHCAYDTRVAGIVSGANGINPGLALHQQGKLEGGQNVALTGRVYALADATHGAIKPGDLLTTSDAPGHLMKAVDRERSSGTILGKAMSGLKDGKGMVLVLVSLQ